MNDQTNKTFHHTFFPIADDFLQFPEQDFHLNESDVGCGRVVVEMRVGNDENTVWTTRVFQHHQQINLFDCILKSETSWITT